MKKIFTLAAVLLATSTSIAQNFNVTWFGEEVNNGETVTIKAIEEDFGFILVEAKSNPTLNTGLLINNLLGNNQDFMVSVRVTEASVTGYGLQLCCGGNCMRIENGSVTKTFNSKDIINGNVSIPFQYDATFQENIYGMVKTAITVKSGTQSLTFNVNFVYEEKSQEEPSFDLNDDNSVDVGDVTLLVSSILNGINNNDKFDLNGDNSLDVGDVTLLVSKVLGN